MTMNKQTKALKMAIEALENAQDMIGDGGNSIPDYFKIQIQTCKEALEDPKSEWRGLNNDIIREIGEKCQEKNRGILNWIDFYNGIEGMLKDKNYG